MNNIILTGRLTHEPECSFIPGSKTLVCKFNLAVSRDFKNKNGEYDTDFIPIELFGQSAEYCQSYINKGMKVLIQGSLRVDRFENNKGEKKTYSKVAGKRIEICESKKQDKEAAEFIESENNDEVPF